MHGIEWAKEKVIKKVFSFFVKIKTGLVVKIFLLIYRYGSYAQLVDLWINSYAAK